MKHAIDSSSAANASDFPVALRAILLAVFLATFVASPAAAEGQLVLIPELQPTLIMMIGFVLLIFPLNALIFKPIFRALDERQARIEGARRRAAQLNEQAEEVLGRYRDSIREVREQTESDRRQQIEAARAEQQQVATEARSQAEREVEQSRSDLHGSLEAARTQLRGSAEELARAAAERILGRNLS